MTRCVIVKSCRECPWLEMTTMPGIVDNLDGTPKQLIWCLGEDNSCIDIDLKDADNIHKDCPLPKYCGSDHVKNVIKELKSRYEKNKNLHDTYHEGINDGYDHAISLLESDK